MCRGFYIKNMSNFKIYLPYSLYPVQRLDSGRRLVVSKNRHIFYSQPTKMAKTIPTTDTCNKNNKISKNRREFYFGFILCNFGLISFDWLAVIRRKLWDLPCLLSTSKYLI